MDTKGCIGSNGFLVTSVSERVAVASHPGSVTSVEIKGDEDFSSGGRE